MTICLPCAIALERVTNAGLRNTGCLDDHLDLRQRNQRLGIGRHMGAARLECIAQRCRGRHLFVPAGAAKLALGARDVEIGDADDVHAARQPRLREKHGAELAGADQADRHRPASGLPFEQHGVEIH